MLRDDEINEVKIPKFNDVFERVAFFEENSELIKTMSEEELAIHKREIARADMISDNLNRKLYSDEDIDLECEKCIPDEDGFDDFDDFDELDELGGELGFSFD